jgi:uncharacterized protein (TIGR03086 family)
VIHRGWDPETLSAAARPGSVGRRAVTARRAAAGLGPPCLIETLWNESFRSDILRTIRFRQRSGGAPERKESQAMSENEVSGWEVLDSAHQALRTAVMGVAKEDWERSSPCEQWNVTQVLQHAAGDQLGFASFITGEPGPSENPFAPSGHLDEAPIEVAERALRASAGAWATVAADAQDTPTPLPQGRMPAWLGAGACALDAAVHAWDMAVATGRPSPLTPSLARSLMTVATAIVEPLRPYGAYAPALEAEPGDDDAAALLRYLGRRPDWTA